MLSSSRFTFPCAFRVTPFLPCVLLLSILAGCNGNTCFLGIINPPNNSLTIVVSNPPPVCSLTLHTAAVKAVAHLAHACTGCSASRQVTRVHLLLSGMELHPGVVADENSPEWQELTPGWAQQPQWVDLVEDRESKDEALPLEATNQVPAGTYYQLRLRLAQPSSERVALPFAESHCSAAALSCVLTADGSSHPLQTLDGHPYVRVEVMPPLDLHTNQLNRLRIELQPEFALQISSGGVLDLMPRLRGHVVAEPSPAN